jgi:hypothetical protein
MDIHVLRGSIHVVRMKRCGGVDGSSGVLDWNVHGENETTRLRDYESRAKTVVWPRSMAHGAVESDDSCAFISTDF